MHSPRFEIHARVKRVDSKQKTGNWACVELFEVRETAEKYLDKLNREFPGKERILVIVK
jgi:hypothetical protein